MPAQPAIETITTALVVPFDPHVVRFKPGVIRGGRALALAYVDARAVQDRLDQVLGVTGWQDEYELLEDGNVLCRLKVLLGDQWVIKSDVGGHTEQSDGWNPCKAAVSDAFKRAAVKFGVGRYLYRLPPQWLDYDSRTRQFLTSPQLPDWALPRTPAAASKRQSLHSKAPEPLVDLITGHQRRHLLHLLLVKGYSARKLAQRYGVQKLSQLTVPQYKHAAGSLAKLPDRMVVQ